MSDMTMHKTLEQWWRSDAQKWFAKTDEDGDIGGYTKTIKNMIGDFAGYQFNDNGTSPMRLWWCYRKIKAQIHSNCAADLYMTSVCAHIMTPASIVLVMCMYVKNVYIYIVLICSMIKLLVDNVITWLTRYLLLKHQLKSISTNFSEDHCPIIVHFFWQS